MKMSEHIICGGCVHQEVCRFTDLQTEKQIMYDRVRIEVEKGNAPKSALEGLKNCLSCVYFKSENS